MEMLTRLLANRNVLVVWPVALAAIGLLGVLRHSTDADYAFASAAIIPVLLVTWVGGFRHGLVASVLAVLMWVSTDILAEREFSTVWIPVVNGVSRLATYCAVAYMMAQVRTLLRRQIELATQDALTGLMNRRAFLDAGKAEANRALRYAHPVAVVFLDLDDFKQLNDSRGHDAGDAALKAVAAALKTALRATDTVARLGGDEFAVVLPEIDRDAANNAANKIAAAVAASLAAFPPVAASIGVAWFGRVATGFDAMLKAADELMYEIKREGKGGVCLRSFE